MELWPCLAGWMRHSSCWGSTVPPAHSRTLQSRAFPLFPMPPAAFRLGTGSRSRHRVGTFGAGNRERRGCGCAGKGCSWWVPRAHAVPQCCWHGKQACEDKDSAGGRGRCSALAVLPAGREGSVDAAKSLGCATMEHTRLRAKQRQPSPAGLSYKGTHSPAWDEGVCLDPGPV